MQITWSIKSFNELSNEELYRILQLRIATFMIEQKCFYEDLDNMDQEAQHLFATYHDQLIAYARIHIHESGSTAIIRRVIVENEFRNQQLGKTLMLKALDYIATFKKVTSVQLSAQFHLKAFYENLGFEASGEPYMDAGILHIKMIKR